VPEPALPRTLAVRLDSDGDVLLTGPALRAIRAGSRSLDLLVSPAGAAAGRLLPGVDEVLEFAAPWSGYAPPPAEPAALTALVQTLQARAYDEAVVFTSFHQSPLPMALLARWAGIPRVSASSEDYPGSLLDVRHRRMPGGLTDDGGPGGGHEVEAALALAAAAGFVLPSGDDGRLRVTGTVQDDLEPMPEPYVVVHPRASVPARSLETSHARAIAERLEDDGWVVVVTGGPDDVAEAEAVTTGLGRCLAGRTTLAGLAHVLDGASCVVVGNTGPAHLAAAVGTPVVSLFSPVVPQQRWRPWLVPHMLLGDQQAPCAGSRARECSRPGHPCLSSVSPEEVARAVQSLAGRPALVAASSPGGPA
jgi:heptosyltransferase-3